MDDSSEDESEAAFDALEEIAVRLAIVTDDAADPLRKAKEHRTKPVPQPIHEV